jgi:glycosyltransferase involved in cell wall biosynthesis
VPQSFDLVVATVDRVDELRRLFESLERQTHTEFRVLLVDQNDDDRLAPVLAAHESLDVVRLRSPHGLSRARNVALSRLRGQIVAFPDDDCVYPDDLLKRVAKGLAATPSLDGLTGRGAPSPSWAKDSGPLTRGNLWNRAISYTIFLRREVVQRVGAFDEQLGLPSSSGEEIDYLVRALDTGARIEYDPTLVVLHEPESRNAHTVATRDGRSIGYILRKHRYPRQTVARMLIRPVGGALVAALRNDRARARVHISTLRGRLLGYRAA